MTEKITPKEYEKLTKIAAGFDYTKTIKKMLAEVVSELSIVNTKDSVYKLLEKKLAPRLKILAESNKALKNLLEMDREQEYELLKKLQKQAETELTKVLAKKATHGNYLKKIEELEAEKQNQCRIIASQTAEIERLRPKQAVNDTSIKLRAGGPNAR